MSRWQAQYRFKKCKLRGTVRSGSGTSPNFIRSRVIGRASVIHSMTSKKYILKSVLAMELV